MNCPVKLSHGENLLKKYPLCTVKGRTSKGSTCLFVTNKRIIFTSKSDGLFSKGLEINELDVNKVNGVSTDVRKKINILGPLLILLFSIILLSTGYSIKGLLITGIVLLIISLLSFLLAFIFQHKVGLVMIFSENTDLSYGFYANNNVRNNKNKTNKIHVEVENGFLLLQKELGAVIENIKAENGTNVNGNIRYVNTATKPEDKPVLKEAKKVDKFGFLEDEIPEL